MHTENVGSTDFIRAAIVAQLAKPATPVSQFWQITRLFKYQVLMWIGIVGSAVTVFGGVSAILQLANWAKVLVRRWHEWNQIIWEWGLRLVGLEVPKELVPMMSFIVFTLMLVIGVNLSLSKKSHVARPRKIVTKLLVVACVILLWNAIISWLGSRTIFELVREWFSDYVDFTVDFSDPHMAFFTLDVIARTTLTVGSTIVIFATLLIVSTERLWVAINSLLFMVIGGCLLIAPVAGPLVVDIVKTQEPSNWEPLNWPLNWKTSQNADILFLSMFLFQVCWITTILFGPLQELTRRLSFVVLGVLTLIGLSEISKLNLHQYLQPAKVSDNLLR
jgi:hypothetical protein